MDLNLKLSDELVLKCISENNYRDGVLLAVDMRISFFGKTGTVYVAMSNIDSEDARYAMVDMHSSLSSSFNEAIEEQDVWNKIVVEIKKYAEQWKD